MIPFIDFVAGMEFHEPCWSDAADGSSGNDSSSGQVLSVVRHAADVLAGGVKRIGVNVKATLARVREDEVAFPRIGLEPLMEPASRHQTAQARHLLVPYSHVQIVVISDLPTEQSINRPTAVDVGFDTVCSRKSSSSTTSDAFI
jgi:hypothetical protein